MYDISDIRSCLKSLNYINMKTIDNLFSEKDTSSIKNMIDINIKKYKKMLKHYYKEDLFIYSKINYV